MAFYRDDDGAVWVTAAEGDQVHCLTDARVVDDSAFVGAAQPIDTVDRLFGPLVEVRPTGWEVV
jgi:hypothetical protein